MPKAKKPAQDKVDLLVAIVLVAEQVSELSALLVQKGFRFTLVNTSGGVFQSGTTLMLVGIASGQQSELNQLIEKACKTRVRFVPAGGNVMLPEGLPPVMVQAQAGSAYVFTLEVDHYETF